MRRLLQSPIALFGVMLVVFVALQSTGDVVELWAPPDSTAADKAIIREQLGLDKPIVVQFVVFMSKAVQGDFGNSLFKGRPALLVVLERLPYSAQLTLASTLIAIAIAIPLGVIAAVRRGSAIDQFVSVFAVLGQSIASFWLALMLMLLFGVILGWLPVSGNATPAHMILPAVSLSVGLMALLTRLTRSEMLEVLGEDFIRTARAKGLRERRILIVHALRNSLIAMVTIIGLSLGFQLGGATVIELIYGWPGVGALLVQSVLQRDYPVVLAGVTVLAVIFITLNLVVDILYAYIDPRIREAA